MSNETPVEIVVTEPKNRKPLIKKALIVLGTTAGIILSALVLKKTTSSDEELPDLFASSDDLTELMNVEPSEN